MSAQYVWRLAVDSWPTENGEPFAWQGYDYWEEMVRAFKAGEPVPAWLPADFAKWIITPDTDPIFGGSLPEKTGYVIAYSDAPDYTTGYGGDGNHLMNVPHATARRYFSKSSLTDRLADLLAWGCEARIERAPIGEWGAA